MSKGGPGPLLQVSGAAMPLDGNSVRSGNASQNLAMPVPPLPTWLCDNGAERGRSRALCRHSDACAEVRSKCGPRADKLPVEAMTSGIGLCCPTRLRLDNIMA